MIVSNSNCNLVAPDTIPAAAQEFVKYCEVEYEQRSNSGHPFDSALFVSAIDLVLRKIRTLEKHGCI